MDFGKALEALKNSKHVAREGWNEKDMWIKAQYPDEHSKMSVPYIYIKNPTGMLFPWNASQQDLFAEDWVIIE